MRQQKLNFKKVQDQVIVITGASSGIGLATAQLASKKGAKLVLAARTFDELQKIADDLQAKDKSEVIAVKTDVSNPDDVRKLKDQALQKFGRIDTWINNAGVSIYGNVIDVPNDEAHKLFETNFWGIHFGCKNAIEAMKNSEAGMIINLGSEVSERAIALQTFYSATKQAVKAYTEGLRTELEKNNIPVGVSLVRPTAINTPFPDHAVNHLRQGEPSLPSPMYPPESVANAILEVAESGKRDVFVGGMSKLSAVLQHLSPRLMDFVVESKFFKDQSQGTKSPHVKSKESLMKGTAEGELYGNPKGHVAAGSLWTKMSLHPVASLFTIVGLGLAGARAYSLWKENDLSWNEVKDLSFKQIATLKDFSSNKFTDLKEQFV